MPQDFDYFTHDDYRTLLKDWFWAAKAENPKVSFRFIARQLGLSSPNHFHLVISAKRHLAKATFDKLLRLLKPTVYQRQYLQLLFEKESSKDPRRLDQIDKQLQSIREQSRRTGTEDEKLPLLSNSVAWYIKMAAMALEGKTRQEIIDTVIANCLFPVTAEKAAGALEILTEMGLLQFVDDAARFDFASVMTKWDFDRFEIKQHHMANMRYALESVAWPIDQRFLNSVTIPCNQALYEELIKNIRQLAIETLERSNRSVVSPGDCEKVVTLQVALFPFFQFTK